MKKRLAVALLAFAFLLCGSCGSALAAKNSDVTRIYKKVITNTDFADKLHAVVPMYSEMGVTEDSVNSRIKMLIARVIDFAAEEQKNGTLTEANMNERFQSLLMDAVQTLEPVYLSMILDAFPQETIENLLKGIVPDEFKDLYRLLAKEAYYVLGYIPRETDIIFDDMQGYEWSYTAVDYLFNKDVINGTSDFNFEPSGNVTREQFVKMICTAFDIQSGDTVCNFSDVKEFDWYYPYVMKMASSGLVSGISDSLFGSGNNIKRQDIAVLIYRIGESLGYFTPEVLKYPFADQNDISSYALTSVNTLKNNNIINGDTYNMFKPHDGASRAEAAQMIYNFCIFVSNSNS